MKLILRTPFQPDEILVVNNHRELPLVEFFNKPDVLPCVTEISIDGKIVSEWKDRVCRSGNVVVAHINPGSGFESIIVGAIINLVISLVVGLIMQALAPSPKKPDQSKSQPAIGIPGVTNTIAPGTPKFFVIGRRRVFGHLIGSKTELYDIADNGLYRKMKFSALYFMGCGPIKNLSGFKVNGTNIQDFPLGACGVRLGTANQEIFPDYENCHMCYSDGRSIPLPEQNEPIIYTTKGDVDKVELQLFYPGGIFGVRQKGKKIGTLHTGFYAFEVAYKKNSDSAWTTVSVPHVQATTRDQLFSQIDITFPVRGKYDVRIRNSGQRSASQNTGACVLFNVMETLFVQTSYPNNSLLLVCGIGSAQIQSLDTIEVSALEDGLITDYWDSANQTLIKSWHQSRAWAIRYVLTNTENGMGSGFPVGMYDDASAIVASTTYEKALVTAYSGTEERDQCNVIVNERRPGLEWIKNLCFEGNSLLLPVSGKMKYVVDSGTPLVGSYAEPGNILDGTVSEQFGREDRAVNTIIMDYPDESKDYRNIPARLLRRAGLNGDSERTETGTLISITRKSHAARFMRRRIESLQLDQFWNFHVKRNYRIWIPKDRCTLSYYVSDDSRGISGFVSKGSTVSLLVLDNRTFFVEPAKTYLVTLYHKRINKLEQRTVTNASGRYWGAVVPNSAFTYTPEEGDVVSIGEAINQVPEVIVDELKTDSKTGTVEVRASIYDSEVYRIDDPLPDITPGVNTQDSETAPRQPIRAQVVGNVGANRAEFRIATGFDHYRGTSQDTTATYIQLATTEPAVDDIYKDYKVEINVDAQNKKVFRATSYEGATRKLYLPEDPVFRGAQTYRLSAQRPGKFAGYLVEEATSVGGPWTSTGSTTTTELNVTGYATSTKFFRLSPVSNQGIYNEVGRWIIQLATGDAVAPVAPASVSLIAFEDQVTVSVDVAYPLHRDVKQISIQINQNTAGGTTLNTATFDLSSYRDEDNNTGSTTAIVTLDMSAQAAGTLVFARARTEDYFGNVSAWVNSDGGVEIADDDVEDTLDSETNPSGVTVTNSTTQTIVASRSIAGGALSTNGILVLTAFLRVTDSNAANNATLTLRLKMSGTTLLTLALPTSNGVSNLGTDIPWKVEAYFQNDNSVTVHKLFMAVYGDQLPSGSSTPVYDIVGTIVGQPSASVGYTRVPLARDITLPASLTGSKGVAATAPSSNAVFNLYKAVAATPNTLVQFGTMTFTAGSNTATFAAATSTSFVAGDVCVIISPTVQDGALSDVGFSLAGTRASISGLGSSVKMVRGTDNTLDTSTTRTLELTTQWSTASGSLSVTKENHFSDYILDLV